MINAIAQFKTVLATGISKDSTAGVLASNSSSDNDGATLPNGQYGLVIDEKNGSREYAIIELDGFNFTFVQRGLSVIDGITEKDSNKFSHRKGAEVQIVSHPVLVRMVRAFNGLDAFGGVPLLPASRTFTNPRQVIDKEYADAIASAGILAMLVAPGTGLHVMINAGTYLLNGVVKSFLAVSDVAVTASQTNYVQIKDGDVFVNITGFEDDVIPLAIVTTNETIVTTVEDKRPFYTGVDVKENGGLHRDATGIFINLSPNSGLEVDEEDSLLKVKVKSGGGLLLDAQGLSIGASMEAYESLVAGDLIKPLFNSEGEVVASKIRGIGTQETAFSGILSSYYSGTSLEAIVPLTESRFIYVMKCNNINSADFRAAVCVERQENGTFLVGTPITLTSWTSDNTQQSNVYFVKRVDDNAFVISEMSQSNYSPYQGGMSVRVCSVAARTITAGTGYSFGVSPSGNSAKTYCLDAINHSGANWTFMLSTYQYTATDSSVKIVAGQIDSAARTITYGTVYDVLTNIETTNVFGVKCSATSGLFFYNNSYRYFSVDFTSNAITFPYAVQTDPIATLSATRLKYMPSATSNLGLAFYRTSASLLTAAKYTVASGIITFSLTTQITSVASSSESFYLYDADIEQWLMSYTIGGVAKMQKINLRNDLLNTVREVAAIPISGILGKQRIFSVTLSDSGSSGSYTKSSLFSASSLDYEEYFAIAQASADPGNAVGIKMLGQIYSTTGLVPGRDYYVGRQGSLSASPTQVINGVTYTLDVVGLAISETALLLKR